MAFYFKTLAWKSFKRSPLLGRNIAEGGFKLLFGLYFAMIIFATSAAGGFILEKYYPDLNVVHTGGAIIMYYFICGLIMRFVFQQFSGLHIKPYMHLPIEKSKLTNFMLNRSFFDFFNLFPLLLVIPFMIVSVRPVVDDLTFYGLLLFFMGLTLVNHFVAFIISKSQTTISRWLLMLIPLLIFVIYLDYQYSLGLIDHLSAIIKMVIFNPWIMPVPAILAILLYIRLRQSLNAQIYDLNSNQSDRMYGATLDLAFLDKHGAVGSIIQLETHLMLRSKRARQYAYTSIFMLLYPLIIFGGSIQEEGVLSMLAAVFVAGAFSLNYGTLLFSWNSMHFDLLLSRMHNIEDYIRAKYYILAGSTILFTLIGLPYMFLSVNFYLMVLAVGLFGLSVIPMIYVLFSLYNSKKMDPNEGGAFSTSGFGVMHFVIMIPVIVIPSLIFYGSNLLFGKPWGMLLIALTGLICMMVMNPFIRWAVREFQSRKYILNEAFREQ